MFLGLLFQFLCSIFSCWLCSCHSSFSFSRIVKWSSSWFHDTCVLDYYSCHMFHNATMSICPILSSCLIFYMYVYYIILLLPLYFANRLAFVMFYYVSFTYFSPVLLFVRCLLFLFTYFSVFLC